MGGLARPPQPPPPPRHWRDPAGGLVPTSLSHTVSAPQSRGIGGVQLEGLFPGLHGLPHAAGVAKGVAEPKPSRRRARPQFERPPARIDRRRRPPLPGKDAPPVVVGGAGAGAHAEQVLSSRRLGLLRRAVVEQPAAASPKHLGVVRPRGRRLAEQAPGPGRVAVGGRGPAAEQQAVRPQALPAPPSPPPARRPPPACRGAAAARPARASRPGVAAPPGRPAATAPPTAPRVAHVGVDHRQVLPGLEAADAADHAREVPLPGLLQHRQVGRGRLLQAPGLVQQHGPPEAQLQVLREQAQPALARLPGPVRPAQPGVAVGQQRVRLAQVRVALARLVDAAREEVRRPLVLADVGVGHAQVEQREGVVWAFAQLQVQQLEVALLLPLLPLGAVVVAGVDDEHVSPGRLAAGAADGRQDLLVDAAVEAQMRQVAEELDVVDDRHVQVAVGAGAGAVDLHDVAQHGRSGIVVGQGAELVAILRADDVVGVHPEDPATASVPQRLVARGREAVAPREVEDARPQPRRDLGGFVGRAGVHDDHFIDPGPDAVQAGLDGLGVVADDHAQGELHVPGRQQQAAARGPAHGERAGGVRAWCAGLGRGRCGRLGPRPPLGLEERLVARIRAAKSTPLPTNVRPPKWCTKLSRAMTARKPARVARRQ